MATIIYPHFHPVDDECATPGKNGKPAAADQFQSAIGMLNRIAHSGRTCFSWWGMTDTTNGYIVRSVINFHHQQKPAGLRADLLTLPPDGTMVDDQTISVEVDGAGVATYSHIGTFPAGVPVEPTHLERVVAPYSTDMDADGITFGRKTMNVSSDTANGPGLCSGVLYIPATARAEPGTASTAAWVPQDFVAPDRGVVASAVGSGVGHNNRYRLMLLHAWNRMRPAWGWSVAKAGTNYVGFTTSSQAYRYIFNQTIGDGGTAPSTTGPGITIPVRYSASGINTTIKCALYVYAAMSGATDTGSVAVAHKAAGGASMTTFGTGTGGPTITGTTFAWYPSLGATPNLHELRADLAYDRVLVAAKSSGATDTVRIAAIALFPMHSTTIA